MIPDYVKAVLEELAKVKLNPIRLSRLPLPDRGSPIVISVVKDELDRLGDFLRHYRVCGIQRFVFVDNGSTDGTVEFLAAQADVDLYEKRGAFEWKLKQGWINKVVELYGLSRWYMCLDADELIVFDGMGERTFADLIQLMEGLGIIRVRGFLIDMYGDGRLLESKYRPGSRLLDAYPWYDVGTYREERYREIISVKGGPRARVFGVRNAKFRPELTKYPIFKAVAGAYMVNPHHMWPYDRNFDCGRILGILHFKFLPNIVERIKKAVEAKNYWDGSLEYNCYLSVIKDNASVSLMSDCSVRFTSIADLVAQRLIARLEWSKLQPATAAMRHAFLRRREALLVRAAASGPVALAGGPSIVSAPLEPQARSPLALPAAQHQTPAESPDWGAGTTSVRSDVAATTAPYFRDVVVDEVYDNGADYSHLDFRVLDFKIRDVAFKQLKFRICALGGSTYLEFRQMSDWPESFENWPALEYDVYGPFMRLFGSGPAWAEMRGHFSPRDDKLIEGLAICLPEVDTRVTTVAGLPEAEHAKWLAAAVLVQSALTTYRTRDSLS